jgi:hypothetical protein
VIIRARQKRVEQLPEWALCCERARQSHIYEAGIGRIVKVRSGAVFEAEVECRFCHRITQNLKYVPIVAGRKHSCVAVDLFDFDEGECVHKERKTLLA